MPGHFSLNCGAFFSLNFEQYLKQTQSRRSLHAITRCTLLGAPWALRIWGEWLFIFRDLGSTGNYFRGAGEQVHSFGDLGSPAKKQKTKIKEKPPFCLSF